MGTLKKFFIYFLIFIVLFIIITILTNLVMKDNYNEVTNYEIIGTSPIISVDECKASNTHVYIKGTVKNDTGEHFQLKYLRMDFYNNNGNFIDTEYKELKYFNVNETIKFDADYNYNNVNKVVLGITDEIETKGRYEVIEKIKDKKFQIALPIAGILVLYTILP